MTSSVKFMFPDYSDRYRIMPVLIIAVAVFVACLFGIWSRPLGFLATLWPANAVMLALLIRMPRSTGSLTWGACAVAFMAADLLTGSDFIKALVLNAGNLVGISTAYLAYLRSPAKQRGLREPAAMLHLLSVIAVGAAAAGIIGGAANSMLFGGGVLQGWTLWFVTEVANFITVMPVILFAPSWATIQERLRTFPRLRSSDIPPAAALLASLIGASMIGGPGAIAFPVPALLWCGLVYPVFSTAILTSCFGLWGLVLLASGHMPAQANDEMALVSWRLGVALIAIAPVMLSCMMQNRNDLLAKLHRLATFDPLTGVSNRNAFRDAALQVLEQKQLPCALLMFDLDHFKTVNDTYGHAGGDQVLVAFAQRTRDLLRNCDLFGRWGGEEFAALAPKCSERDAMALAERIRTSISEPLVLDDGRTLSFTASIGVAVVMAGDNSTDLDALLHHADAMLYRAKRAGRDCTEIMVVPVPNKKMPKQSKVAEGG